MFQHPLSGNCKIFLWWEVAKSKYDTRGALEVHPAKWNDCAWRQQTTCATLTFRMWRCVLSGITGTLIHSKWVFIYLLLHCYQVGVSRDLTIIKILVRSSDHDRFLFKLRRGHRACRMVTNFMKLQPKWGHRIHIWQRNDGNMKICFLNAACQNDLVFVFLMQLSPLCQTSFTVHLSCDSHHPPPAWWLWEQLRQLVSKNSRSRPFPGMKDSDSCHRISGKEFLSDPSPIIALATLVTH